VKEIKRTLRKAAGEHSTGLGSPSQDEAYAPPGISPTSILTSFVKGSPTSSQSSSPRNFEPSQSSSSLSPSSMGLVNISLDDKDP